MNTPRYLDTRGVADYLTISRNMVPILVQRGALPPPVQLSDRIKRWDREAIDAALAGGEINVQGRESLDAATRRMADELAKGRPNNSKAPRGR